MVQLAGEFILAEDIVPVRYFRKTATESVTSSTTMQDDDDLAGIPLSPNKTYHVEFYGAAAGAVGGDIKIGWVLGGGAAQLTGRAVIAPQIGMTDITNTAVRMARNNLGTVIAYGTEANPGLIFEAFIIETTTSGLAGTLTMQWAQNASSATPTQLTTSTYLIVTEVEAG